VAQSLVRSEIIKKNKEEKNVQLAAEKKYKGKSLMAAKSTLNNLQKKKTTCDDNL